MRKILLLSVSLLLAVTTVFAERVSQEDAALVANNFMNPTSASGVKKAPARPMVLKAAAAEDNQFYVYENASGEGWVMVAADDAITPILAYSKTGTFRTDNMPLNVQNWMNKYNQFIKRVVDDGVVASEEAQAQWKQLRKGLPDDPAGNVVVGPLVKTTWDQGAPFDLLVPGTGTWGKGSSKAAVGCVATAMAQVMNYWKWPVKGVGSHKYKPLDVTQDWPYDDDGNPIYSKRYTSELSADFGNTTYDWANMLNAYTDEDGDELPGLTTAQKNAVATLMYHCGVASEMMYGNYDDGGSGTFTVNYGDWDDYTCAQSSLAQFFNYKKSTLTGYMRDGYSYGGTTYYEAWSDDDWTAMIKEELDKQHPIMYAGAGSAGGHSFVCDGYDDKNYFHFNWGWSGQNDGWYTLSKLKPGSGGAGGGSYDFSQQQDVIIGIVPNKTDYPKVTVTWSVKGETTTTEFTQEDPLVLPANPANCSDNQVFVGWSKTVPVNGAKPADLFTTATGKTVSAAVTYYAIFATLEGGSSTPSEVAKITFKTNSSDGQGALTDFSGQITSKVGISSVSGTKAYAGISGIKLGSSKGSGSITLTLTANADVSKVTVNAVQYKDEASAIKVTAGSSQIGATKAPATGLTFEASSPITTNNITIESSKRAYISSVSVIAGSGPSYKDYTTTCSGQVVCTLSDITINTTNVQKTFYVGDVFNSIGLVVTASYSNCDSKTVNATVSAPDMSTPGEKTVTVSYTENGVTKSKTYEITVSTKPVDDKYTVTWHSCDGVQSVQYKAGDPLALPANPGANGTKTFYGWAAQAYTGSTAPTLIQAGGAVNANADYYAIYK